MVTTSKIYINNSNEDVPFNVDNDKWIPVDNDNDSLIISKGSDRVKNGESLPGEQAIISAGMLLEPGTEQIFPKYFLASAEKNKLFEIPLMGNVNAQHPIAIDFSGYTASEPVLEAWDSEQMNTAESVVLGAGIPQDSWIKAIATTLGSSGENWVGTPLAGSSDGHFLWLNGEYGELQSAVTLYFNLKVVVPAFQEQAGNVQPILVVKYARV